MASALVLWEIMDPLNPSMVEQLDEALLGRAVLALELAGEVRGLCRLMGWWCARAKPGLDSRLSYARASCASFDADNGWFSSNLVNRVILHNIRASANRWSVSLWLCLCQYSSFGCDAS